MYIKHSSLIYMGRILYSLGIYQKCGDISRINLKSSKLVVIDVHQHSAYMRYVNNNSISIRRIE